MRTNADGRGQRRTDADRGGERETDADIDGQRRTWTNADRGGQSRRRTDADTNGQRRTDAEIFKIISYKIQNILYINCIDRSAAVRSPRDGGVLECRKWCVDSLLSVR